MTTDFVYWLQSCENTIVCWKPGRLGNAGVKMANNNNAVTVLHRFEYRECDIWFMRFSLNSGSKVMALGNQIGKTYVWDLDVEDPVASRYIVLSHPKCITAIRQTALSRNGNVLLCVCDDASVWRWDKVLWRVSIASFSYSSSALFSPDINKFTQIIFSSLLFVSSALNRMGENFLIFVGNILLILNLDVSFISCTCLIRKLYL